MQNLLHTLNEMGIEYLQAGLGGMLLLIGTLFLPAYFLAAIVKGILSFLFSMDEMENR